MKYRHSFNPEGKTKIKGKEHLDITGYFPKVGKKKTIPIELSELWVSDEKDMKYMASDHPQTIEGGTVSSMFMGIHTLMKIPTSMQRFIKFGMT